MHKSSYTYNENNDIKNIACDSLYINDKHIKGKEYLKTQGKYYVSDLGFRYFMLGRKIGDFGHILENVVYFELLRRGYEITIGCVGNYEIDFVCKKMGEKIYVQVTRELSHEETIEREFRPLLLVKDNYPKYVISTDEFDMSQDGIIHMNILDFLLDDEI